MNQISPRATYIIGKSMDVARYVRCIESSKRVRWDIADNIIQGWDFDTGQKFSPDGITKADQFTTLPADEKLYLSQIQG